MVATANRVAICSRSRSSNSGLTPVSRPAISRCRPWVRRRPPSRRSHQCCSDGHIRPAPHPAPPRTASPALRSATVRVQQQFPARAVPHHCHPSVRVVSRRIQRVPPPPVRSAPYHCYRVARPGLALPVVINEDGARLLPRGVDATCRQHGVQGSVLIRLVARRRVRERACLGWSCRHAASRVPRLAVTRRPRL